MFRDLVARGALLGGLFLSACGGGSAPGAAEPVAPPTAPPAAAEPSVVSGLAATGGAIAGRVFLKDALGQERFVDTADGRFSFVVDGLTAPFMLKAQWNAAGSAQVLYSWAAAAGTANITPLSNLALGAAAGGTALDALYAGAGAGAYGTLNAALPASLGQLQQALAPLLERSALAGTNPLTTPFAADHTGLDALLDTLAISQAEGRTVVADRASGALILEAEAQDLAHPLLVPLWTPQDASVAGAPDLAAGPAGQALAVWVNGVSAASTVEARWLAPKPGATVTLNGSGLCSAPRVAIDAAGNALVLWAQYEDGRNDIWARRYSAAGQAWAAPVRVSAASAASSALGPELALDAAGNAVATWSQGDGRVNHFDKWLAAYDAATGRWTAPVLVSNGVDSAYGGRVALNAAGQGLVVWQQAHDDGTQQSNGATEVWARSVGAGAALGAPQSINALPGTQAYVGGDIAVAVDSAGNGIAAWVQNSVQAAVYRAGAGAGSGWQASQRLLTDPAHGAYRPSVAFDAAGNAVAVWQEMDGTNSFGGSARYTAGQGWGASASFASAAQGNVLAPRLAVQASGQATVVWYTAGATATAPVFVNRAAAGAAWGSARKLADTPADGYMAYPVPLVAAGASGPTLVVWGLDTN